MSTVAIKRSDKTLIFGPTERDKIREVLKGKVRWDRRTNRWLGLAPIAELKELLEEAGYEVRLMGPPARGQ
ncbi:MAG: hypothetical protein ACE5LU_19120 [Anaerolineae bacterium]